MRHGELLHEQLGAGSQEGEEGTPALDVLPDVEEAVVEVADDVEDESAIGDWLAQVAECICHALEATTVVGDGEVTLDEVAELHVSVEGVGLPVAKELSFNGKPGGTLRLVTSHHDLGKVRGDRAVYPGLDDVVHARPV